MDYRHTDKWGDSGDSISRGHILSFVDYRHTDKWGDSISGGHIFIRCGHSHSCVTVEYNTVQSNTLRYNTTKLGWFSCLPSIRVVLVAFCSLPRIWGEYSTLHSPPALFFNWRFSSRTLIPLFMPGSVHSGSASWDDCGWVFPDELLVSSFLHGFPHYAWIAAAHSDFVVSRVYACVGVTCHLQFWEIDRGILRATAVTRGWNGHRIKVSTQRKLSSRQFSRRSCRDSNWQPFDHESGAVPTSSSGFYFKTLTNSLA